LTDPRAKKTVKEQGGTITHEFSLIKGFTYVGSVDDEKGLKKADLL
jgi:hypothetical protein